MKELNVTFWLCDKGHKHTTKERCIACDLSAAKKANIGEWHRNRRYDRFYRGKDVFMRRAKGESWKAIADSYSRSIHTTREWLIKYERALYWFGLYGRSPLTKDGIDMNKERVEYEKASNS